MSTFLRHYRVKPGNDERRDVGRRAQRAYIPEMRGSKFYKAMVGFDDGGMTHCDAVEYDDTLWLVPKWLDVPAEGYRTPERMLRLDQFQHQMFPAPSPINVAVSEPIPHELYSGELTQPLKDKYIVYERPDFRFKTAEAK